MNILYLTNLSGSAYAGPTYSVPQQIKAQAKLDNVFWYNVTKQKIDLWCDIPYYHDKIEYPKETIEDLPTPFSKPDIVVIEGFYNITNSPLRKELIKNDIPYIIVPRGELTDKAQKRKRVKKFLANKLMCNRFAKNALAIEFLTKQEFLDSGKHWNDKHIIVPNGIIPPKEVKKSFSKNGIQCVSIGRIEPYQKGLDLLIEACTKIKYELLDANCTIDIYGPDTENKKDDLERLVKKNGLENIICFHDGVYKNEKIEVLLNHDVFIMPSRFEGHPMALIEAMSYGLACLVTTGSNMLNEVKQINAGWTATNNVDSIKDALLQLTCERTLFPQKSNNAYELAKRYSWDAISNKSHEIYEKLLNDYCNGE